MFQFCAVTSLFILNLQIEKIVLFLLEQQGLLASRLSNRREEYDALLQQPEGKEVSEVQEAYRAVGQDLLRLLFFVEMNAIGLRKILKKFDKRLGYKFTDYYVKTRSNHPYSQLRQVFKHVVMCSMSSTLIFSDTSCSSFFSSVHVSLQVSVLCSIGIKQ